MEDGKWKMEMEKECDAVRAGQRGRSAESHGSRAKNRRREGEVAELIVEGLMV
jgi:hypothetical protein